MESGLTQKSFLYLWGFLLITLQGFSQGNDINYDEAKVGSYRLPDPLKLANGDKVTTVSEWETQRRPEILNLFKQEVYGQLPGKPTELHFQVTEIDKTALNGLATRKQVTVYFTKDTTGPSMEVLLYLPNNPKGPVPAFAGLNFYGNHCISTDPSIKLSERWMINNESKGVINNRATEAARGMQASRWPVEELMQQGFALATVYYGDLEPDHAAGWQTGIRTTMAQELGLPKENWSAIGAWAWGLSRLMDFLVTEPAINSRQIVLTGHSRIGKAALWAGANDTRYALVVANDSGEGGAALSRRNFGETITRLNNNFPHWFSPSYARYNNNPNKLPVDQHLLLSLVAPRPLYISSAVEDRWSDPKGEFLGALHAGPVYQLYAKKGITVQQMPPLEQPVGETIGYHIRKGKHDITFYDWQQHIAFAKKHFLKPIK
ncbi:hypothetical protein [Adhaeribacter aquaticus]|uniref:glucuronyl esterase domain-containing protein n=1 Tax=Adhaeribacter aquaticus TaxID=299567 RepID=UPI0003FD9FD9|nr:hypothetical protein [Adhaeribacter aquaticus]